MGPPKKKANSAGRTSKRRRISEETVSPRNDEIHDQSTTDPAMLQSITAAVTKSVMGELQKAGIIAGQSQHDTQNSTQPGGPPNRVHPDQHQDNALSQTVTTAPPDEGQQRASSTTTLNNIDSVQLPAILFANTTTKPDGTSEFSNTSYKPLGRPLYTKINGKLQEKIRANEFVDMADILDPPFRS